jgi:hypothetical protein
MIASFEYRESSQQRLQQLCSTTMFSIRDDVVLIQIRTMRRDMLRAILPPLTNFRLQRCWTKRLLMKALTKITKT